MDKKTFGLGMIAGIGLSGIINVATSLAVQAINKRNAQKALDALANLDENCETTRTCCAAESEE